MTIAARNPPQSEAAPFLPPRRMRLVLAALLIAMLLATIDNLILSPALPTIVGKMGGLNLLSWVITAYTITTAASTPIWGKLGDMYGRKGVFLVSIVIFLIGSALAGMSQTVGQLIGFRAIQGLGGGGLMVGAFAIMGDLIPPQQFARYQGMFSAVMGLAMIGGPMAGGVITDQFGWRWNFYVNLPLGVAAIVIMTTVLQLPGKRARGRIDYAGAGMLTTAITSLVLVTTWGGSEYGWASGMIVGLGALAVVATAVFIVVEHRATEPILPPGLFRDANFSLVTLLGFLLGFAMLGAMTFLPIFQQAVKGDSATSSGLLLLPMIVAMLGVNVIGGQVISRRGEYKIFLIVGGALLPAGLLLLAQMGTGTSRITASIFMVVFGAGIGLLMQSTMVVALGTVEKKDLGVASSTVTLSRTIGGSVGIAVMGALFTHRVNELLAAGGGHAATAQRSAQLDAVGLRRLPDGVRSAYEHAVAGGIHTVFLAAAAIGVIGFVPALFVKRIPLRGMEDPAVKDQVPSGRA